MEKLKVPNPGASDLGEQFGIPLERKQLLSKELDRMVKEASSGQLRVVTLPGILLEIQAHCQTQEEFVWCICNHVYWLYRTNRTLSK